MLIRYFGSALNVEAENTLQYKRNVQYEAHVSTTQNRNATYELYRVDRPHQRLLYNFLLLQKLVYHKTYCAVVERNHNNLEFGFGMYKIERTLKQAGSGTLADIL